ncbi:MAG: hypothetical protein JO212_08965 [Acetobacteraceae bacterium]|nr:hypothetical protein [Acetobacteraceae bacterium]MBV8590175.1 hypothetical protein [Acetobacteraceae bacterium]
MTAAPIAGHILQPNVYGWFERIHRGVHQLTATACSALL